MQKYGIILAGGMGSRLWPLSRKNSPKQLIEINGKTMIERTAERLEKIFEKEKIYIITRKELKEKIIESTSCVLPENIIEEKEILGTAYAIFLGLQVIYQKNMNAIVSFFPSDAYIENEMEYIKTIKKALYKVENEKKITVIGIEPRYPSSGMGYIQCKKIIDGYGQVNRFVEKPSIEKAELLMQEKTYFWNAGVVISTVQTLKEEFLKFLPQLFYEKGEKTCGIKGSFDKLILEKSTKISAVIGNFGWEDIGTFDKFRVLSTQDHEGNTICNGAMYIESKDVVCIPQKKRIMVFGVNNLIIVESADVILVMDRIKTQEMETVIKYLEENELNELL